jgi:hypothetical protein
MFPRPEARCGRAMAGPGHRGGMGTYPARQGPYPAIFRRTRGNRSPGRGPVMTLRERFSDANQHEHR